MKEIRVLSKKDLKNYKLELGVEFIRATSEYPMYQLSSNKISNYFFDDTLDKDNENFITESEARSIIKDILDFKKGDSKILIVTCDYGKGRSPAIAKAACEIIGIEKSFSEYKDLNIEVYNKIMEIFYADK